MNTVVPPAELGAEVRRWADEILALSPTALRFLKQSFNADTEHLAGVGQLAFSGLESFLDTEEARRACARSPRSASPTSPASDEAPGTRIRRDQPHPRTTRATSGRANGLSHPELASLAGPGPVRGGAADDAGGGHARRAHAGALSLARHRAIDDRLEAWISPGAQILEVASGLASGNGASSSGTVTGSTTSKPTCRTWPSAAKGARARMGVGPARRGPGRPASRGPRGACLVARRRAAARDRHREGLLSYLGRGDVLGLWRRFAETLSGFRTACICRTCTWRGTPAGRTWRLSGSRAVRVRARPGPGPLPRRRRGRRRARASGLRRGGRPPGRLAARADRGRLGLVVLGAGCTRLGSPGILG